MVQFSATETRRVVAVSTEHDSLDFFFGSSLMKLLHMSLELLAMTEGERRTKMVAIAGEPNTKTVG